jgi:hypothetical protein
MGKWGVKARCTSLFDCSHLFVPTAGTIRWRAQIESRPPRRGAAKRLGLDAIEHAIRLLWSGRKWAGAPVCGLRSKVRAGLPIWFACQIKLTFGRRTRRLHQHSACGGQAREDEATLRCGFFKAMQSIGSSTRIGRG